MAIPGGEEEMKQKISLGDYAFVSVRLNLDDGKSGISIYKKPYNSDHYSAINLDVLEWNELAHQIGSLADSATDMDAGADGNANSEVASSSASTPSYPSKLLSTRVMAKLNLFSAPNGQRYVTMAVRPYVMDSKTSVLKLTKEGVTLNMKEILCLQEKKAFISETIEEQTASTYNIALYNNKDLVLAQKRLESFFVKASPGQKLRMILKKKPAVVASDAPTHVSPDASSYLTPDARANGHDGDDYDNDESSQSLPRVKRMKSNNDVTSAESQEYYVSDEEDSTLIVNVPLDPRVKK